MANPLAHDLDHVLKHTRAVWEELRGRRLFITGGTGFFGCWLLESFAWANDKLALDAHAVVLTRNPAAFRKKAPHLAGHPAIHLHLGDVRNFDFPDGHFSHIIHAAIDPRPRPNARDALLLLDVVINGTRQTLDFAVACHAKRFLLTSSGAIYGPQPHDMTHIPEDFGGAPNLADLYAANGESKRVAEILCAAYAIRHPLEPVIARGFTFIGPYLPLNAQYAAGNFLRDALAGGPIVVQGDGAPLRSYLYAADLAIWLWTILCKGASCRPYNVGSEEAITIANLADAVASCVQPHAEVRVLLRQVPGQKAERYVPSTRRAELELGLRSHVALAESVARTLQWYRRP